MAKVNIDEKLGEIQKAFNEFDKDGKGWIDAKDFITFLRSVGQNPSQQDADNWIRQLDLNENGKIEFYEFVRYYVRVRKEPDEVRNELASAFKVLDKDGDGYVSSHELYLILRNMGETLSEEDAKEMIRLADVNGDGKIDIEEYTRLMCKDVK